MLVAYYPELTGEMVSNTVSNPKLLYNGHSVDFMLATAPAVEIRLGTLATTVLRSWCPPRRPTALWQLR
ncbi:unnamed protein product [Urochloa humidicola]